MTDNLPAKNVLEGEIVETYTYYSSNNSGGSFWLSTEQWLALEAAGWVVEWGGRMYSEKGDALDQPKYKSLDELPKTEYYMGEPAVSARRYELMFREAIQEFADVTGEDPAALGCGCCGPPHGFTEKQVSNNAYVRSMEIDVEASWRV